LRLLLRVRAAAEPFFDASCRAAVSAVFAQRFIAARLSNTSAGAS
jgi:hypothetical protein